jgi:uncharacterized protein YdeI (YjbR/CyaY-like superfamily)
VLFVSFVVKMAGFLAEEAFSSQSAHKRMLAAGLMTPAGQAKIDATKQDGSWSALDAIEALEIPPDLAAALATYTSAQEHFDAFPRSVKRGILEWISTAKTA